ncbi:hypothetical protein F4778DRAFT_796850 [Xylariomycetidae sp. FL2044]|nr:hypothetical protein F4778DRAFT_796850 [Xylariomycetidae sp. FL2044]
MGRGKEHPKPRQKTPSLPQGVARDAKTFVLNQNGDVTIRVHEYDPLEDPDVVRQVRRFKVDRATLAAASPVFKAMLTHDHWIDSQTPEVDVHEDTGVTCEIMASMVYLPSQICFWCFFRKSCLANLYSLQAATGWLSTHLFRAGISDGAYGIAGMAGSLLEENERDIYWGDNPPDFDTHRIDCTKLIDIERELVQFSEQNAAASTEEDPKSELIRATMYQLLYRVRCYAKVFPTDRYPSNWEFFDPGFPKVEYTHEVRKPNPCTYFLFQFSQIQSILKEFENGHNFPDKEPLGHGNVTTYLWLNGYPQENSPPPPTNKDCSTYDWAYDIAIEELPRLLLAVRKYLIPESILTEWFRAWYQFQRTCAMQITEGNHLSQFQRMILFQEFDSDGVETLIPSGKLKILLLMAYHFDHAEAFYMATEAMSFSRTRVRRTLYINHSFAKLYEHFPALTDLLALPSTLVACLNRSKDTRHGLCLDCFRMREYIGKENDTSLMEHWAKTHLGELARNMIFRCEYGIGHQGFPY